MKEVRERRSRNDVVRQLREVFRRFGYEGATLTRISDQTGLGRASLYHHFPNGKDEMIHAVLVQTEETFEGEILARLHSDLAPEQRIKTVLEHLWDHYKGGSTTCFLAVLALTSNEGDLGAGIQRVFRKWISEFAQTIQEAGIPYDEAQARAEDAVLRIQGALVLAHALNDPLPFQRVMLALNKSLLAPGNSTHGANKKRSPARPVRTTG